MSRKMMEFRIIWVFVAAAIWLIPCLPAYSQVDAGSIRGTVVDPAGAVVPKAKVTLTNQETGLSVNTSTAQDGVYSFSPVKIGMYAVQVEAPSFEKSVERNIRVEVQQQVKADIKLTAGAVTETVEVRAVAPLLQTQDASVGNVATSEQINGLPLNGRNYTFLAQLGPGVTGIAATRGLDKTGSFMANGLTTVHNNYILDGIDNNNDTVDFLNGAAYVNLPPPDAIQEFKVQTSNFSAEFGRAGGAVVNATIKSGTNSFHGSLWEFLRNDKLDATDEYFTNPKIKKGELRQNQFGAAIGGPIFKNKTFFFADYDGTRIRQGALRQASVPTAAEAASGFTDYRDRFGFTGGTATDNLGRLFPLATILDPATTRAVTAGAVDPVTGLVASSSGFVRDPFYTGGSIAGITDFTTQQALLNQLPANRLDANALKLLGLFPAATQPGISNNFNVVRPQPDDNSHFDVRVDQNFSQHDQMFGRVSYSRRNANFQPSITGLGDNSTFGQGAIKTSSMNVAISETHAFSETMINEARFGYSKLRDSFDPSIANKLGIPAQFGISGVPQTAGNGGLPTISISGLTDLGAGGFASPNRRRNDTIQITENLTKVRGPHSFKGGFEYQRVSFPWIDPAWSRGALGFGGFTGIPNGSSPGVGAADILLSPTPTTVTGGVDNVGGPNLVFSSNITQPEDLRHYYGTYFQDDWKVSQRLTVNLGLRWEVFGALQEKNGRQAALDPGAPNGAGAVYQILAKQKNVPLSPLFAPQLAKDGIGLRYINGSSVSTTPLTNFAPRIGLAYQLSNKLVTRAGYGVFFSGFENIGGSPDPGYDYPFAVNLALFRPSDTSPLVYPNGQNATLEVGLS
ncbi:MAG: carboxypeptidase-like regulatory domain-containing protein, partial [Acidobacteriota bacterium]|nr:carboxypeptidase-like regulatory domain-containing protein [Acidobacteriota bacterium]